MRDIKPEIQEILGTPSRMSSKKSKIGLVIVKLLKIGDRKKFLKACIGKKRVLALEEQN